MTVGPHIRLLSGKHRINRSCNGPCCTTCYNVSAATAMEFAPVQQLAIIIRHLTAHMFILMSHCSPLNSYRIPCTAFFTCGATRSYMCSARPSGLTSGQAIYGRMFRATRLLNASLLTSGCRKYNHVVLFGATVRV